MNEVSDLCPSRLATQPCHMRAGRGSEVALKFLTSPGLSMFRESKWVLPTLSAKMPLCCLHSTLWEGPSPELWP